MSFDRLDRCLREVVGAQGAVPGAVVLVRQGAGKLFHEAYGYAQKLPFEAAMRRDALFDLASLTKPVCTGLLAMRLRQAGALALDHGLSHWFPTPEDPAKERITVRHLLCNRSGLPAWRPFHTGVPPGACPVPVEEVRRKILAEPLLAPPGTEEIYSDLGFMLLGWVLERLMEASLDALFRERIVRPLDLGHAAFRRIGVEESGRASRRPAAPVVATEQCPWRGRILRGEVHDENCYLLGGVAGHAGVFATAEDLDRIAQEILLGWRARSEVFSYEGLHEFLVRDPQRAPAGTWALGWDTPTPGGSTSGRYFSSASCGHNGFTGTSLWIDLDREISVILLTNRIHPTRTNTAIRALRPRVHDLVMEELLGTRPQEDPGSESRIQGSEGC